MITIAHDAAAASVSVLNAHSEKKLSRLDQKKRKRIKYKPQKT